MEIDTCPPPALILPIPLDQTIRNRAQSRYGRGWQKKLAEAVLAQTRRALGLDGDLSPNAVAALLGCTRQTVYRYISAGIFPNVVHINSKKLLIPAKDVAALQSRKIFIAHDEIR